ncbi:hypothetical protein ID0214_11800 [Helicobacter pylori]
MFLKFCFNTKYQSLVRTLNFKKPTNNPLKWYNSYYALNKVKGSGNLDVATGLNYRYKHSKYWD